MEIEPSFSRFRLMAEKGNLISVCREIMLDTETPVSIYLRIRETPYSYLLESAERGERWGRYSIVGYDPHLTAVSYGHGMEITDRSGKGRVIRGFVSPISALRHICGGFSAVGSELASPFQGGPVGYCNYDVVRTWERLPQSPPEEEELPQAVFTISGRLIIFDHLTHRIKVAVLAHVRPDTNLEETYRQACRDIDETVQLLRNSTPPPREDRFALSELRSNFTKKRFMQTVEKAREYIAAGDVIQVVLSQRLSGQVSGDDFALYRNLRSINPSPYMFYLNFGEIRLIGASPEILVRLTGRKIQLRPIAGTRPRGDTPARDQTFERELLSDPKERAEHVMLVDLGRNDAGRVAVPGSVSVHRLMGVERYSHVMHMVSDVEGELRPDMDAFDLFMSAFPAGTVSGAPKIRAMEIIDELEPAARGPYAGAVGYFGFNGNMDFCITIRTITIAGNRLSVQVGAGIVADSSPEAEYEETMKKAGAMLRAIEEVKKDDNAYR
ncbi:MAG TPA: anthranilate synthase component I [Deltaproteobacteria bacterium]|nr:anthranilate synthase component I [Deltaproteobacteria bacterium]